MAELKTKATDDDVDAFLAAFPKVLGELRALR